MQYLLFHHVIFNIYHVVRIDLFQIREEENNIKIYKKYY